MEELEKNESRSAEGLGAPHIPIPDPGGSAPQESWPTDATAPRKRELDLWPEEGAAELARVNETLPAHIAELRAVEEELRSERDASRALLDGLASTGIAVSIISTQHEIISQNRTLIEKFGDLTGKLCYESYMRLEQPCDRCPMPEATQRGRVARMTRRGVDGRDYMIISAPLSDGDRVTDRAIEVILDVTEHERAKAALASKAHALDQRIKELNCLYTIGALGAAPDTSLDEIARPTVDLLPSAMQYPEIACARITIDDQEFRTPNFRETDWMLCSQLLANAEQIGVVQIGYLEERTENDEGPFLKEERRLTDTVARLLGGIVEHTRTDALIRESEERYRAVLEGTTEGILVADIETGKLGYANPAMCEMLGYSAEELRQMTVRDIHPRDDLEHAISEFEAQARGEKALSRMIPCLRSDGTTLYTDITTSRIVMDGRACSVGFFTDISDRIRAEESVRESEKRLQQVLASSPDAITVTDVNGRITECNRRTAELHGFPTEAEVIGRNAFDSIAPEDRERARKNLEKTLEQGFVRDVEYTCIAEGGRAFPAELSASTITNSRGEVVGFVAVTRDVSDRHEARERLKHRLEFEEVVASASSKLANMSPGELDSAIRETLASAGRFLSVDRCVVYAVSGDGERIRRTHDWCADGVEPETDETADLPWNDLSWGQEQLRSSDYFAISSVADLPPKASAEKEKLLAQGVQAVIAVPIVAGGSPIGLLGASMHRSERVWTPEAITLLRILGEMIGNTQARNRAAATCEISLERTGEAMEGAVHALSRLAEVRDPYTAGHQQRVAELARAIAREMGLTDERAKGIHMASLLHDIGKIHVPGEILSKPGLLDDLERDIIRTHPKVGYDILYPVKFPWPVAEVALEHHERLDGSGYPQGLSGDEISLEARIVAVADIVEAMSTHRPHRPALSLDAAIAEISRNRGTLYDPEVVDACLKLLAEKRFRFGDQPKVR